MLTRHLCRCRRLSKNLDTTVPCDEIGSHDAVFIDKMTLTFQSCLYDRSYHELLISRDGPYLGLW